MTLVGTPISNVHKSNHLGRSRCPLPCDALDERQLLASSHPETSARPPLVGGRVVPPHSQQAAPGERHAHRACSLRFWMGTSMSAAEGPKSQAAGREL